MNKQYNTKGFTLIELLVVIAIIGVLASIVLASLNSARRKSRDARRITDVKQIQLALELYYDAQSVPQYPLAVAADADCANRRGLIALVGPYIPQVTLDPQGVCYAYATPAAPASTYHLGATLEDDKNPALSSDKDCDSSADNSPPCGFGAVATGFDGAVSTVYDVVP